MKLRQKVKGAKRSKTVWYGLALAMTGFVEARFSTLEHLVPQEYRGLVLMGIGLLVVYLRFLTTAPLEALAPPPANAGNPPDNDPVDP